MIAKVRDSYSIIDKRIKLIHFTCNVFTTNGMPLCPGAPTTLKKSKYCYNCKAVSVLVLIFDTVNVYEIARIWNSKYHVHVCMIQTNADFIFQNLLFLFLVYFKLRKSSSTITAACNVLELISVRVVLCTIWLTRYFVP